PGVPLGLEQALPRPPPRPRGHRRPAGYRRRPHARHHARLSDPARPRRAGCEAGRRPHRRAARRLDHRGGDHRCGDDCGNDHCGNDAPGGAMSEQGAIHLVRGDDPVLVGDEVRRIVTELVSDGDRARMVDELDESRYLTDAGAHLSPLVDAAQTPPFLTDRRVVVGRHLARFTTAESVAPLVAYLDDPLPTTSLVLVWDKGPKFTGRSTIPKSLTEALKR